MNCAATRKSLPLLLYGELSCDDEELVQAHLDECEECRKELEREKRMQALFDQVEVEPSTTLLRECRQELRARLAEEPPPPAVGGLRSWLERFAAAFTTPWRVRLLRPMGALALIAAGFVSAWFAPFPGRESSYGRMGFDPMASHVRYVEPAPDGRVQIVVDETRQRIFSGNLHDENIRRLLLAAAKDPADPGLRGESVELLTAMPDVAEVRSALLSALQHDSNAGVRLKALDGLKPFARDPEVRRALAGALLADGNPGVRTQAIDLLIQGLNAPGSSEQPLVGVLQELLRKENNSYVRLRCQRALQEMNASVETY